MVKSVNDGFCDEYDSANARLQFASANAQDNMLWLDLIYAEFNQRRFAKMSSLLQRPVDTSFIWEIDQT